MYRVATGGVKLQVPEDMVAEARVIISQSWALESDEWDLDSDFGEVHHAWENPQEDKSSIRLWITEIILILLLVSPLILWLLHRIPPL